MSDLGPPTLVQQNEQIIAIPKGSGETSSTEVVSSRKLSSILFHVKENMLAQQFDFELKEINK